MQKIVLASASPRRALLLKMIGLDFSSCATDIDESIPAQLDPAVAAKLLSLQKAEAAAVLFKEALIIAADTIVVLDDRIYGKPADTEEAKRMLNALSGRTHHVFTGITVLDALTGKVITQACETKVKMLKLTEAQIEDYVATGEPADKAGAYGIQGYAACFVQGIDGCYFNVMGLPLSKLTSILEKFGVYITENWVKLK